MKTSQSYTSKLAIVIFSFCPALSLAAVPAASAYNNDITQSYVQDQTTSVMSNLNNILCTISSFDGADMVNLGAYVALSDQTVCNGNSGSTNTGSQYMPAVVISTRTDNSSPMILKAWLNPGGGDIQAEMSATQAPSTANPYGLFRMDFCQTSPGSSTACDSGKGFIDSISTGLSFFQTGSGGGSGGTQTTSMLLNASSTTAGSGKLTQTQSGGGGGNTNVAFTFAFDANYFTRSDGTTQQCFDRSLNTAAISVWSYGLYDATTGDRIQRNSGFPIAFTDATGAVQNGYVGYYGVMTQVPVPANATVTQASYNGGQASTKTFTLMQTGGKLTKFTNIQKTLAQLDKVTFNFNPSATVAGTGGSVTAFTSYDVYWDNTNSQFVVTGTMGPSGDQPLASRVYLTPSQMNTASPYGIFGYSQMLGGGFQIGQSSMASLSSTTPVMTQKQDVIYPSDFAALGGLKCLNNCPTAADITLSNASNGSVQPYASSTTGWAVGTQTAQGLYTYTLDATTGNLIDGAISPVIMTSTSGTNQSNNMGINSGNLVAGIDMATLDAAVVARSGTIHQYLQSDFNALNSYYQWQTGPSSWNTLGILLDASNVPVKFDPPLNVSFTVPSGAQYGNSAGSTVILQYSGFGNLFGIPSSCIDMTTNQPCIFSGSPTTQGNQHWTPQFSIPTGSSVTVSGTQGTVPNGTTYLVKPLNQEVRLHNVSVSTCTNDGLSLPNGSITLPTVADWINPSLSTSANYVGSKPTFAAKPIPEVIQGVKMY